MPVIRRSENFPFEKGMDGVKKLFKDLPQLVGNMAVNFYKDSFQREGFIDSSVNKWAPRKADDSSSKKRSVRRGLLKQSGDLERSIEYEVQGRDITVYSDVPYASAHNDGFSGPQSVPEFTRKNKSGKISTVSAHTRQQKIPQRQFIGKSDLLNKRIELHIVKALDNIFK